MDRGFLSNTALVGLPLPIWGTMTIWFTSYNDFFTFHKAISAQTYLSWGLGNILSSKLLVLEENYLILSGVVYIPFIFIFFGMWIERKRAELLPFVIYLLLVYSILSLVFTFPSIHGSLLHSMVILHPLLYALPLFVIHPTFPYIINPL